MVKVIGSEWRPPDPNVNLMRVQNEGDVNAYLSQYLYWPLENAFPLPGFKRHVIRRSSGVLDMVGEPNYVATALNSAGQQHLLFVAESKTKMTFAPPAGSTTAEAWQDAKLRSSVDDGLEQVFGYMLHNDLTYSMLTSGELFVFIQRDGRSLQVADVPRTSNQPTPMQGIYYLMQRQAPISTCIWGNILPQQPMRKFDESSCYFDRG